MLIIEVCPNEPRASMCLADGSEVTSDADILAHVQDCNASGDCKDACRYVMSLGIDWRIVARNASGEYENRNATDDELTATAQAIYFDSSTDFDDVDNAQLYLVWEAAREFEE
jgi:hypothetical protein